MLRIVRELNTYGNDPFAPETHDSAYGTALSRDLAQISSRFPGFAETWGERVLPPVFLKRAVADSIERDLSMVAELALSLPERFFNGDELGLAARVGISSEVRTVLRETASNPGKNFRADILLTESGPKLVEINWGSRLGGYDLDVLHDHASALLAVRRGFDAPHDKAPTVRLLEAMALRIPDEVDLPNCIFLLVCGGSVSKDAPMMRSIAERLRLHGLQVWLCALEDLAEIVRSLPRGRFPVLVRYFQADDLLASRDRLDAVQRVLDMDATKEAVFWASTCGAIYASKGLLSLIHELAAAGALTDDERSLIARFIPATYDVRVLEKRWEAVASLKGWRRESLVLKPKRDMAGAGLVFGAELSEQSFAVAWARAHREDWVVQDLAVPIDVTFPTEPSAWRFVLGAYMTPEGSGGYMARARPSAEGLLIAASNSARSRIGTVLVP